VNYRASTGYGHSYRNALRGQWGVADLDDCLNAARLLVDEGLVDIDRMAIRGGSAGGYTTLCALTFSGVFSAGSSNYGISDLTTFVDDTHKFESRYVDSLVGPYPEAAEIYEQRSPLQHLEDLKCPVILLQGLDDKVVPPSQSEWWLPRLSRGAFRMPIWRLRARVMVFEGPAPSSTLSRPSCTSLGVSWGSYLRTR
jgi:dipeptidyl aminopeptidase/acylaminoacyl peptidase